MKINVVEIDKDNLPTNEVICLNMKKGTLNFMEKMVGYLYKDKSSGVVYCEDEYQVLEDITHYIIVDYDE